MDHGEILYPKHKKTDIPLADVAPEDTLEYKGDKNAGKSGVLKISIKNVSQQK